MQGPTIVATETLITMQLTSGADRAAFAKVFAETVVDTEYTSSFSSLASVLNRIREEDDGGERLYVGSAKGEARGFVLLGSVDGAVSTLFTLPCTPETKIPWCLARMLTAPHGDKVLGDEVTFKLTDGYNEKMSKFFEMARNEAKLVYTVVG